MASRQRRQLGAGALTRRFEAACRRRLVCKVEAHETGGAGLELRVATDGLEPADTLSVRGLDDRSWSDSAGMESLARVVSVFLAAEPEPRPATLAPAPRPRSKPRPSAAPWRRRGSSTGGWAALAGSEMPGQSRR